MPATRKRLDFLRKAYDPEKHPHGAGGKFAATGSGPASLEVHEVSPAKFREAFSSAFPKGSPMENHVTHYTEGQLAGMKCFTTTDGKAGVAVHDHGDGRVEATALFNNGGPHGAGLGMLRHAINAGANYVECYGPKMNQLYASLGFEEQSRSPFDPKQAAPSWDYAKFGSPDYMTMRLLGTGQKVGKSLGVSMTPQQRDAKIAEILSDTDKFKRELDEGARRDHPEMTDEQREWAWRQLAAQFGL